MTYPFACVPFLYLFFVDHGLDAGDYGEILTAYYVTMFVAEVPTGVLTDRFGKKRMLVLGPLVLAAGFGAMLVAPNYTGFLVGEILLGLGHAILSGPPTAVLYETLLQNEQQHRYLAEEGRIHASRLYGTGTAFLIGGLLVRFGDADGQAYELAILVTCALHVIAALCAWQLPAHKASKHVLKPREFFNHARHELRKTSVRWLLFYWLVLFMLLRFPFHNYQPYLKATGETEPLFADPIAIGMVFAVLNLVAAPLSAKVPQVVTRFGRRALFWSMPIVVGVSLLVMSGERFLAATGNGTRAWCWLGVSMFFVQQVPFAMHWPILHEFVNHRIGSAARTTVLSVMSLAARSVYALVNVLLFHLQARHGLRVALMTAAIFGMLCAVVVMWARPRGLLRDDPPEPDST